MTPVPLDLPVRPAEAAEVGTLIFEHAERRPLTDEVRNRIAARAAVLRLDSLAPRMLSLARDPIHPSSYYFAADAAGRPMLLHIAPATAPTSSVFPKPLLIGRMRKAGGPEIIINAIPFGAGDGENIEKFATSVDTAFLPRPPGSRPAIAVDSDLPEAFEAFRTIWKKTGKNLAAVTAPADGYYAAIWAAIRSGWREGYSAGLEIAITRDSIDQAKEAIRTAPGFTRFALDLSTLSEDGLETATQLHEFIRQTRSARKISRSFDFEISLGAVSLERTEGALEWLKLHEHPAQLLAAGVDQLEDMAEVARRHQCGLSIAGSREHTPEILQSLNRATLGRFLYKAAGPITDLPAIAEHLLA